MFAAGALLVGSSTGVVSADDSEMVYELRTYTCNPGKLPNLHARFKNHTMKLFEKHGMKNIMYWTPLDQEDTLIYIVAHESREAADKSWKAFVSDPEWKKAYQESIADGKLVKKVERKYMKATEYSP
ncbi:MAG: NIPSNAP family protein [Planctomycetaceae bacterium]|nr:NIPSNAP family protein [Planctomycetaceae bacterium]